MKKRGFIILIISVFTVMVIISIPNKKSFEEVALKYYSSNDFSKITIFKDTTETTEVRYDDENRAIIQEILEYLSGFKYVKLSNSYNLPASRDNTYYEIRLHNNSTKDLLEIEINNKSHIRLGLHYLIKEVTDTEITNTVNSQHVSYKIYKGSIDMDYINTLFEALRENAK